MKRRPRPEDFRCFLSRSPLNTVVVATLLALPGLIGCQTTEERRSPSALVAQDRHVAIEGQPNFRDLGGYKTADGRTVKWGLLYRSGALNKLTDADLEKVQARRIAKIIDLRVDSEVAKAPDRVPAGVQSLRLPVGSETNLNALTKAIKTGNLSDLGQEVLFDANREFVRNSTRAYAELLKQIADPANRPILWHCTLGKDRAGLSAAIVLLVLGVPKETILEDYLLSNTYRAQEMQREMSDFKRKQAPAQDGLKARSDELVFQAVIEARREYLQAAFDEMIQEYGSITAYIRQGLGVSKAQQKQLQDQLLE